MQRQVEHMFDILIIGGGIAAVSAALTARNRGKSVAVVSGSMESQSLYKAEKITNYPGVELDGKAFSELLQKQLEGCGAELIRGRALSVMNLGGSFGVAVGNDFYEARSVILALGITREALYPGEGEFLGRGVSYCATCDGMLYKGKKVALIGNSKEAYEDAAFLREICSEVLHFAEPMRFAISGGMKADTLTAGGVDYKVDAVFIIKDSISVSKLAEGLERDKNGIAVDRSMATSIPGIFAAGDCTGKPYQLAKAAGEGNIAALSACEYIQKKGE